MSSFAHPKIAAIDDALSELEPVLEEFGRAHGFILTRSHNGSLNVPRRWLHRESAGVRHEVGLIISAPMPERLDRGFHPDLPCTLYIAAFDLAAPTHYYTAVVEAQPFGQLRETC